MDDEQYRQLKDGLESPPCVYEKALLQGYFVCRYSQSIRMGEREAIRCSNGRYEQRCLQVFQAIAQRSGFAVGQAVLPAHLPFAQAMKVQIGGLQGLSAAYAAQQKDVAALMDSVISQLSAQKADVFSTLDYATIVKCVAYFSLPRRKHSKPTE